MSAKCIICIPLKDKERLKTILVRIKLSVDARMLKTLTSLLRSRINFIQHFCSFIIFIYNPCIFYIPDITVKSLIRFH